MGELANYFSWQVAQKKKVKWNLILSAVRKALICGEKKTLLKKIGDSFIKGSSFVYFLKNKIK